MYGVTRAVYAPARRFAASNIKAPARYAGGSESGKVVPQKEWIDRLVRQADEHNSIVFMKESLRSLMGNDFRQDELLWRV